MLMKMKGEKKSIKARHLAGCTTRMHARPPQHICLRPRSASRNSHRSNQAGKAKVTRRTRLPRLSLPSKPTTQPAHPGAQRPARDAASVTKPPEKSPIRRCAPSPPAPPSS